VLQKSNHSVNFNRFLASKASYFESEANKTSLLILGLREAWIIKEFKSGDTPRVD